MGLAVPEFAILKVIDEATPVTVVAVGATLPLESVLCARTALVKAAMAKTDAQRQSLIGAIVHAGKNNNTGPCPSSSVTSRFSRAMTTELSFG